MLSTLFRAQQARWPWRFGYPRCNGQADNYRFDMLDLAKIGGSVKFAGVYQLRDLRRLNVPDVALTIIEQLDFLWVGIESQDAHA